MGSFSWLKADELTKIANVSYGSPFKFLIPKEFGGGFIKDNYQDYGYLGTKEDGSPKYDVYELLAFWNSDDVEKLENVTYDRTNRGRVSKGNSLKYDGDIIPKMKEIDKNTSHNRSLGIDIGCYDEEVDKLKYPLKLVSASFKGTYEDLDRRSYSDPWQGFGKMTREKYKKMKESGNWC